MSNWEGKPPVDKLPGYSKPTAPNTSNASNVPSEYSTLKYIDKVTSPSLKHTGGNISLFSETNEQPTYFAAPQETYPSRSKITDTVAIVNQNNSQPSDRPFTNKQMRYPSCSSNSNSRNRIKMESSALTKYKNLSSNYIANRNTKVGSLVRYEYTCCHCRSWSGSSVMGSHCLTTFHLDCFNKGVVCPDCFKVSR